MLKCTHEGERNESEAHDASSSVGSSEGVGKSSFGAIGNSEVCVCGDGHTDEAASHGGNCSDGKGEGGVSMFELFHGSVDDEKHHTNKNNADEILLLQEFFGSLS